MEAFIVIGISFLTLCFAGMVHLFKVDADRYDLALLMVIPTLLGCWWLIAVISPWFIILAAKAIGIMLAGDSNDDKINESGAILNKYANLLNKSTSAQWRIKASNTIENQMQAKNAAQELAEFRESFEWTSEGYAKQIKNEYSR